MFRIVAPGDTDGDGKADSSDLFAILGAGKLNHPELGPATWGEGDFTGDTLVNSADLFAMLAADQFNQGPYTSTPPDLDSSVTTTTATASTSLLSTIDAGDSDQLALASSGVFYFATYGPIGRGQASHRPNSPPLARSANANTSTIDDSGNSRCWTVRLRHSSEADSPTLADLGRTKAVDDLMRALGRSMQPHKEKLDLNVATHNLSDVLLEDLATGL